MTKDEIVKTEASIHDAVNAISDAWFNLGVIDGYDAIIKQLRTKAGELFAGGNHDDQAELYRAMAEELEVVNKLRRRVYDAGAMLAKETAYADLQRLVNTFATEIPYDNN